MTIAILDECIETLEVFKDSEEYDNLPLNEKQKLVNDLISLYSDRITNILGLGVDSQTQPCYN